MSHLRDTPSWALATLTLAIGFLVGVVVMVAVRDTGPATTRTVTVVRTAPPVITNGGTVIEKTAVPIVVGETLDTATARVERAGFKLHVDSGGGLFGPIIDSDWEVTSQTPAPGTFLERGSTVHVAIQRA